MSQTTVNHKLKIAIIGSGPAGFYAADNLFKHTNQEMRVDMFDRLPTPHGLVRSGVAPDHQKIKTVTRVFDKIASNEDFRFFGNVEFGKHISLDDLKKYYNCIIFATGAQTDKKMNIPGEELSGSHPATEFVAWYNGHPYFKDIKFDLSSERVAIIGVGNVAIDVARILCLSEDELRKTDIADYALDCLLRSNVKEVFILGRRGPAQASFTNPELSELGKLLDADAITDSADFESADTFTDKSEIDKSTLKKLEILKSYSTQSASAKPRKLIFKFLVSPVELLGDEQGKVNSLKIVKNELYTDESGNVRPRTTDKLEYLDVGMVFRSIGYSGVPLPGVPFNKSWGVIPNEKGRIISPETKEHVLGLYATGWIKRGPSGVIGTNKPDAAETVGCIIEDFNKGLCLKPVHDDITGLIRQRQPDIVTYEDWLYIDNIEITRGQEQGRPRIKICDVPQILNTLKDIKDNIQQHLTL